MALFDKMGIFGLASEENYFLAAMLTGDPLLMIGTHGCGKTMLSKSCADVLQAGYQCYDASKAMFEDILGFPNPKSLAQGEVDYIPTPMSILPKEFVLVDEISRAHVQMQNKWLEVIRSRTIMGVRCIRLKWVWAAMNPLSYEGAVPLDEALAGRFSLIVIMPETFKMEDMDAMSVVQNENSDDCLALDSWGAKRPEKSPLPTQELKDMLKRAGEAYFELEQDKGPAVSNYVVRLMRALYEKKQVALDGRRLGMIRRNILSVMAIERAKHEPREIEETARDVLLRSMPHVATGQEVDPVAVLQCHELVKSALRMRRDVNYQIMVEKDPIKRVVLAVGTREDVHPNTMRELVGTLIKDDACLPALLTFAPMVLRHPEFFDIETVTAVSGKLFDLQGAAELQFTLDRASVLALENYGATLVEMRGSAPGLMAMRAVVHMMNKNKDSSLTLFSDMCRKMKTEIERAVDELMPTYRAMESGEYGTVPDAGGGDDTPDPDVVILEEASNGTQ